MKYAIKIKDVLIGHYAILVCASKSFHYKLAQPLTVDQNLNFARLIIVFMSQNSSILSVTRVPFSILAMLNNTLMNNVITTTLVDKMVTEHFP